MLEGCDESSCSQKRFKMELPIFMFSTQSLFQMSSFVDLTRVIEGPSARWAPEQFMHTNTPKSREAPEVKKELQHGVLQLQSEQNWF